MGSKPKRKLTRPTAKRIPQQRILIICEGEKTEPLYFTKLKLEWRITSLVIRTAGGTQAHNLVDCAIAEKEKTKTIKGESQFDQIWCIKDVEIPMCHKLQDAYIKARDNGIQFALTFPCFEYWLILHFENTARFMESNDQAIKHLKKHISDYEKGSKKTCEIVFPKIDYAISNADQIMNTRYSRTDKIWECNPSTQVHELVGLLQRMRRDN
jgi:hypothetical protein